MNRFKLRLAILGAFILGTASAACSLTLDWDPEGLPCEDTVTCADGYSCLVNLCILNDSVPLGSTCNKTEQCEADLICANFTCATSCTKYYESSAECPSGEYCMEHIDENGDFSGHCEEGNACTPGEVCQEGRMCVEITTGSNACLVGCEITWGASGQVYSDSCGGNQGVLKYCQPLGKQDQLVCRDTDAPGEVVGQSCDLVDKTCSRELACVNGTCRKYCNLDLPDEICDADLCCDRGTYAVCHSTCEL